MEFWVSCRGWETKATQNSRLGCAAQSSNPSALYTGELRFNEPLFNEVLDITNDILCCGQSYSKMYRIEPRYNEFFDITNIIRKPKRKIYLDITNYNVNTRQKINAEQINTLKVSFFGKQKRRVCSKVKIIATEKPPCLMNCILKRGTSG